MTWYNPKTWFTKPEQCVYVSIILDKPFQGIHEKEPAKPYIKINGLSLAEAAQLIPGRAINWHTVPMGIRAKLEISPYVLDTNWDELKGLMA